MDLQGIAHALNVTHGLLVIQLLFPRDTVVDPVAARRAPAQVLLATRRLACIAARDACPHSGCEPSTQRVLRDSPTLGV